MIKNTHEVILLFLRKRSENLKLMLSSNHIQLQQKLCCVPSPSLVSSICGLDNQLPCSFWAFCMFWVFLAPQNLVQLWSRCKVEEKLLVSRGLSDVFTKFGYFDRILQWILYHSPSHESESSLWWASTWLTFPNTLELSWKIIR